jgi:hypothetical protein
VELLGSSFKTVVKNPIEENQSGSRRYRRQEPLTPGSIERASPLEHVCVDVLPSAYRLSGANGNLIVQPIIYPAQPRFKTQQPLVQ